MSRNEDLGWMAQLDVLRIEEHVSVLRLISFAALAVLVASSGIEGAMSWSWAAVMVGLLVLAFAPTAVNWTAARRRQLTPRWWYVGHTADVIAITGAILGSMWAQSPAVGLLSAVHLAYFVVIIASATRFHERSTVYVTLLSVASYVGLAIYARLAPGALAMPVELQELVAPSTLAMRPIGMFLTGLLTVTMIRRAQRVTQVMHEVDRKQARVIQQMRDGFLMCDADHRIVDVNAGACEMLTLPRSNLLGLRATVVLPAQLAAVIQARWEEILEDGAVLVQAIRVTTERGEKWVDVAAHRIPHPDQPLVQFVLHDVTAEHKLRDQSAQYEKLQGLRALTTGAAHEFNNIFATIEASSFILSEAMSKQSPRYTEVEAIRSAATRAARFARDLLDMADMRPTAARPLDTAALLHKVVKNQQNEGASIEVKFDIPDGTRWIVGDEGQLERSLGNLILQGYRSMLDGGTLTISARNVTLAEHDGELAAGDYVRLCIRDTGIGMPPDIAAKAFDPLSQTESGATGIVGLSIVQTTVARHAGSIQLESAVGQGTVFTLSLPATEAPIERAIERRESLDGERARRLLVVDDEPANRTSLARLLSFRGYEVLLADDGMSAIRIAEDQGTRIDLVLLDLLMPEMNGKDVLTALRARHPTMKVLLVTGYAEQVLVQEALDLGAAGVAYKPFDVPTLLDQVQQLTHGGN